MKPTKPSKYREMSDEELLTEAAALSDQLLKIRFQAATGQQEDPVRLRVIRRNRARIKTILREREIAAERGGSHE
jgi:large subunit ribosomal protein L29